MTDSGQRAKTRRKPLSPPDPFPFFLTPFPSKTSSLARRTRLLIPTTFSLSPEDGSAVCACRIGPVAAGFSCGTALILRFPMITVRVSRGSGAAGSPWSVSSLVLTLWDSRFTIFISGTPRGLLSAGVSVFCGCPPIATVRCRRSSLSILCRSDSRAGGISSGGFRAGDPGVCVRRGIALLLPVCRPRIPGGACGISSCITTTRRLGETCVSC